MATLRTTYSVWWDDGPEIMIKSTVMDLVKAVDMVTPNHNQRNQVALTTAIIFSALEREGHDVGTYEDWLLVLDNYEEKTARPATEDPTQMEPSSNVPSSSPVLPGPIGDRGLTAMTTGP